MLNMSCVTLSVLLLLVFAVAIAHRCPQTKICVPIQFCPHQYNISMSEEARGIRTRKGTACHTSEFSDDDGPRVCCDRTQTSLEKPCKTTSISAGKCVAPEQCRPIAKYLKRKVRNAKIDDELKESLCYRENSENYYCCPENLTTPPKKHRTIHLPAPQNAENDFSTCKDSNGKSGLCVPVNLCDHIHRSFLNNDILKDKMLADYVRSSTCHSEAKNGYSICCAGRRSSKLIHHRKATKLGLSKCGPVRFVDKILQGSEAGFGQYPWMANLMYNQKGKLVTLCSGSLIHPRYVLTAAHCMMKTRRPVSVRLGEYNLSTDPDCVDGICHGRVKEYPVEKLIPNNNFNGINPDYDIALIRLKTAASLSEESIYPICLPLTESLLMQRPKTLTVTGWGRTEKQESSSVLLEADLQMVPRTSWCDGESTFCARGGKKLEAHCRGDSGGPYQAMVSVGQEYKYVLFGVISAGGLQCSVDDKKPGVGVMVGYHINWILDNMMI